ncbi:hypothetical protein GCM10009039_34030 [Halocalculus aciditolerans]|uniref:Uncharacterized protein n=2 Tax=Halocalculus aciditolerans TaxID=1383812 RepID=A0A830FR41_9EURY|nr:hypothetical protein GCM10009039_34030 [Halocalculus aciditolerans]
MLLQLRVTGADSAVALGVLGLSLLSITLSVIIAATLVRGYLQSPRDTGILVLAIGLFLLTTVPELLRIGLPTFTAVGTSARAVAVSGCQLVGLAAILWAIYGGESR